MTHKMRLNNGPFELIQNGSKTIELRLNDEKRSIIKENDIIIFENRITKEVIKTEVIKLHQYNNFEELYKYFDKISLGYKEDEVPNPNDMELYYSKEEQEKYGVIGIEIKILNENKKEIINNYDNLNIKTINRVVRRAKLLIENSKDEIMLCHSNGNYFFLGGHVDDNESDMECLHREILEEAGVDIVFNEFDPFMTIKYLNKDYPEQDINTFTMANYYSLTLDLEPNYENINLTEEEKTGNFTLEKIKKEEILEKLNDSLSNANRKGVTLDTIEVLKEYLKH